MPMAVWQFLTRWGNSLLLLPAASWIVVALWADGERRIAWRWAISFGAAVGFVLATKVAFLGWGVGSRALDFTGISGHSALAAAVLPMFAWWLAQDRERTTRTVVVVGAASFAVLIGQSRLELSTHSISEVVAGLALGLVVAAWAVPRHRVPTRVGAGRWLAPLVLLVLGSLTGIGSSDGAHGIVVRIALALSGRAEPFQRSNS